MDILGITSCKTVADIGASSGWFTVRVARRVGDTGVMYAVDIDPEPIQYVGDRAKKEELHNIKTSSPANPATPLLPADAVDAVLLLKTTTKLPSPSLSCAISAPRFGVTSSRSARR